MAPFIKYTEEKQAPGGTKITYHYVNTDFIRKASYFAADKHLTLVVDNPDKGGTEQIDISGKEAEEAAKKLDKLN